jgi:UDP-GlcNAc:undecaprenyl-phosphate/decaprenyl-phosphate GlcNAc-1-phosphate transferase
MEEAIPKLANSAILSLLLINVARSYAGRLNLLDRPGGRKRHLGAVPTVGGICIYCAFLLALSLDPRLLALNVIPVVNMGILVCVGALDDAIDLSPVKKLAFETIAAVMLVAITGAPLINIAGWLNVDAAMGMGFAIVMTLCVINAVNMADGVDGLAGWLILVALAWLIIGGWFTGSSDVRELSASLAVPVLAFLAFNSRAPWHPSASVFMGDAGTLMLGYAISWFCLGLMNNGIPVIASSLVVAVPVSDTISLFFRRLMWRRSPFSPDRNHLHHLLENAGLRPGAISLVLASASAMIGGIGIVGAVAGLAPELFLLVWIAVLACHYAVIRWLSCRSGVDIPATAKAAE